MSKHSIHRDSDKFPSSLPWRQGIGHWWRRVFRSRPEMPGESLLDIYMSGRFEIIFPIVREVVRIELESFFETAMPIESVEFQDDTGRIEPIWRFLWRWRNNRPVMCLDFAPGTLLSRVMINPQQIELPDGQSKVRLVSRDEQDALLLQQAQSAYQDGDFREAGRYFAAYDEQCRHNRVVVTALGRIHDHLHENDLAEIYALRSIALEESGPGLAIYEALRRRQPWHRNEHEIAGLEQDAGKWDLAGHHGLVVLDSTRSFLVAHNGIEREQMHMVMLVRRRLAARKMRRLFVPMVNGPGGLLFTEVRIRRTDGATFDLEADRFTVGSSADDNPFIAVARRREGSWILPDLQPGDVIEYTYDLLRFGEQPFMLASLAEWTLPTMTSRVLFTAPDDWPLDFEVRNAEIGRTSDPHGETGYQTTIFSMDRILPRQSHSDPYQRLTLNPMVACARRDGDWSRVAEQALGGVEAAVVATEEVPLPLASAIGSAFDPREVLSRAFYWVRDHIKYGAVVADKDALTAPDRAQRIVAAGTGDCKDVSFLLAVVCRVHRIPWEFVLLSTSNGVIVDSLPADQFDHVIVRARIDDQWVYLDASSSEEVFGGYPYMAQGQRALAGGQTRDLVTIPDLPRSANRIKIHETIHQIVDGWLMSRVELELWGWNARRLDEELKYHSLVKSDDDHAVDVVIHNVLPGYVVTEIEQHQGTADSDIIHLSFSGRRCRLIALGDRHVGAFRFQIPGLPFFNRQASIFSERFVFPFLAHAEYRLEFAEPVRTVLRELSDGPVVDTGFFKIDEEPSGECARSGFVRRIQLLRRVIDGTDLARLPEVFEHHADACEIVAAFAIH